MAKQDSRLLEYENVRADQLISDVWGQFDPEAEPYCHQILQHIFYLQISQQKTIYLKISANKRLKEQCMIHSKNREKSLFQATSE